MRSQDILDGVAVFVAAADAGSFSEAGRRLGISPSAVSQAIRGLEDRLGGALFRRSTRSLSLTDCGEDYLRAAAPALAQLRQAADAVTGRSARPAGPLRLTMPRAPFELLIAPLLPDFQDAFPDIELDIAVEARLIDIVKQGYDAGLRYGKHLEKDMAAIPVAPASEAILAASPHYLDTRTAPDTPENLIGHRILMCRSQATGQVIPWTLRRANETVQIAPPTATIVHDLASQIALARRGAAIVNAPTALLTDDMRVGRLRRVLPEWSSPLDAVYLYFPSRRGQSATLRAFIGFLRSRQNAAA